MRKWLGLTLALLILALAGPAFGAERTVHLSVPGMTCASCPHIVRMAIGAVDGVASVEARLEDRAAIVVFDEGVTSLEAIQRAAANAGYRALLADAGEGG